MSLYSSGAPRKYGESLNGQRAIEPRYGFWTLPAGFMENDETVGDAARRETGEEVSAKIELVEPNTMLSMPRVKEMHVFSHARLLD